MKRYLSLLLALAMLFTLSACGSAAPEETAVLEPAAATASPVQTEAPIPEESPAPELELGVIRGTIYENGFIGIGCSLGDDWSYRDRAALAGLGGQEASLFAQDEGLVERLLGEEYFYDMYADTKKNYASISIAITNLGGYYGLETTAADYADDTKKLMEAGMGDNGFSGVGLLRCSVEFAGKTHEALHISATYQGVAYYSLQVYIKQGDQIASISIVSNFEDISSDLAELFYAL